MPHPSPRPTAPPPCGRLAGMRADGGVQIRFRATDGLDADTIAEAVAVLSDEERAQYERFHFARDARDYAAAHALLRHTLARHGGLAPDRWRFGKDEHGKPFLVDAEDARLAFSLSHTDGMVACAVTMGTDVGVDVECVDRDVDAADIAARFFAPSEAAHLQQLDGDPRRDRFFDFWTLKEALVKALGLGLAYPLHQIAFAIDGDGGIHLSAPADVDPHAWDFRVFAPGARHRLAVAVRRLGPEPARLIVQSASTAG